PVEMDWRIDFGDAVLGKQEDLHGLRLEKINQVADNHINALQVPREAGVFGAEPLQGVIQVGQVNQVQGRVKFALDPLRRFRNPPGRRVRGELGRVAAGGGSPKRGKGKLAQVLFDFRANGKGPGVNIENLSAISRVDRAR